MPRFGMLKPKKKKPGLLQAKPSGSQQMGVMTGGGMTRGGIQTGPTNGFMKKLRMK